MTPPETPGVPPLLSPLDRATEIAVWHRGRVVFEKDLVARIAATVSAAVAAERIANLAIIDGIIAALDPAKQSRECVALHEAAIAIHDQVPT